MIEEAVNYNKSGLQLLNAGKYDEALEFFTKSIAIDPSYPDPYHNRGEIHLMLGRIVEGNTDIYKAKELRSGKLKKPTTPRKIKKTNWQEVESNIYDDVFLEHTVDENGDEAVTFDNEIYDYVFSDDSIETDKLWDGLIEGSSQASGCPAVLEFLGGTHEEVSRVVMFQPTEDDITVIRLKDGKKERFIPLKQLSCVRLAALPSGFEQEHHESCQIEIIQTTDGNLYHEFINPNQNTEKGLIGFSTKEDTYLPYIFFPRNSIKSRCLQRQLGEILLENRFISNDALQGALEEHQMLRGMQLGKIIARQDNILCSVIETALENAQADSNKKGMKIGEILLDAGIVNEERLFDALAFQKKIQGKKLGDFLIGKGILREQELYISLAEKFRIPFIDLRKQKVSKKLLTLLPREVVLKYTVMPIGRKGSTLIIASPYPDVSEIRKAVTEHLKQDDIEFVLAQPTHLKNVVNILYKDRRASSSNP